MVNKLVAIMVCALAVAGCARFEQEAEHSSTKNMLVVCATAQGYNNCRYHGDNALQQAVDASGPGDTILIRAGRYKPNEFRDLAYGELVIRGAVLIKDKTISLQAEDGVVFEGSGGIPSSAIVIANSQVELQGLHLYGFRYASPEDNTYDGHGVFIIDSQVKLQNVSMRNISKMALTAREQSRVTAVNLEVSDSHIGLWVEEQAQVEIKNAHFRDNDSAGIAAYQQAIVEVTDSLFDNNQDDGIYAEDQATIRVKRSRIVNNKPYGVRGIGNSRIWVEHSYFSGNENDSSNTAQVRLGAKVVMDKAGTAIAR